MADRLTRAEISLDNYTHNISEVIQLVGPDVKVMAIVKANAYGHGIEAIAARALSAGASHLGVVSLGELKRVRAAGITAPVLVLNYIDAASVNEAVEFDATFTVMDEASIRAIATAAAAQSAVVKIHIKVDTGMHRAGCAPVDLVALAQQVQAVGFLELEGVFTHFAESEAPDGAFTRQQLQVFTESVAALQQAGIEPPLIHCANSAAIIALPETHFTMVRPGIVTYGLNPFPAEHEKHAFVAEHFAPVLSLVSQVVFVRELATGETVGYNRRWTAERPSTVALVPIGYGDGYRRTPHNAGFALLHGQRVPIIGSVAMDQLVVDVTDIQDSVAVGDDVVLLGAQGSAAVTADDIAASYDTINYEVVTALSDRITRQYS